MGSLFQRFQFIVTWSHCCGFGGGGRTSWWGVPGGAELLTSWWPASKGVGAGRKKIYPSRICLPHDLLPLVVPPSPKEPPAMNQDLMSLGDIPDPNYNRMYIWLSLIGLKLETGTKISETVSD